MRALTLCSSSKHPLTTSKPKIFIPPPPPHLLFAGSSSLPLASSSATLLFLSKTLTTFQDLPSLCRDPCQNTSGSDPTTTSSKLKNNFPSENAGCFYSLGSSASTTKCNSTPECGGCLPLLSPLSKITLPTLSKTLFKAQSNPMPKSDLLSKTLSLHLSKPKTLIKAKSYPMSKPHLLSKTLSNHLSKPKTLIKTKSYPMSKPHLLSKTLSNHLSKPKTLIMTQTSTGITQAQAQTLPSAF